MVANQSPIIEDLQPSSIIDDGCPSFIIIDDGCPWINWSSMAIDDGAEDAMEKSSNLR